MDKLGAKGTQFKVKLDKDWCDARNGLYAILEYKAKVMEKPYRKWYKLLLQYLTLGYYQAPFEKRVKLLDNERQI